MAAPLECFVCLASDAEGSALVLDGPLCGADASVDGGGSRSGRARQEPCCHFLCVDCWRGMGKAALSSGHRRPRMRCPLCRQDVTRWAMAAGYLPREPPRERSGSSDVCPERSTQYIPVPADEVVYVYRPHEHRHRHRYRQQQQQQQHGWGEEREEEREERETSRRVRSVVIGRSWGLSWPNLCYELRKVARDINIAVHRALRGCFG